VSYTSYVNPKTGRISHVLPGSKRSKRAVEEAWVPATQAMKKHVRTTYKTTGQLPAAAETAAIETPILASMGIGVAAGALSPSPGLVGEALEVAEVSTQIVQGLDWVRDLLDQYLPEEMIGLELGGSTAGGLKMYNGVWVENGKVKYTYPGGKVRVLGYTPQYAKKKYRTHRRSKRLTKRDMYFGEIARTNPTTAMGIIQQMI